QEHVVGRGPAGQPRARAHADEPSDDQVTHDVRRHPSRMPPPSPKWDALLVEGHAVPSRVCHRQARGGYCRASMTAMPSAPTATTSAATGSAHHQPRALNKVPRTVTTAKTAPVADNKPSANSA